jgi:electron transfer flavoprotein alpha subunit
MDKKNAEVWVYIQHRDREVLEPSLEVLGKACELAESLQAPVAGILAGDKVDILAEKVLLYGAQKVYIMQSRHLEAYSSAIYAKALCKLARSKQPSIFLFAATPQGRDLAPRVASALKVGLTADCTDLKIGSHTDRKTHKDYKKILLQVRPAWGGNIIATIISPETRPQMATIREGIMKMPQPVRASRGDIIHITPDVQAEDIKTILLRREIQKHTVDLKGAGIIVAGGAGMGTRENFEHLGKLASVLGGQVAATRAAVDAGFIGHEHQVGQTGISVRPKLYIACGISGAVQHLAGMQEAGKIVAVNTDPEAPIFSVAHYGIVGDAREVVPKLINLYRQLSH